MRYLGLDGVERVTSLEFEPAPTRLDAATALYELSLGPGEGMRSVLRIACRDDGDRKIGVGRQFYSSLRTARRALRASSGRAASVDSSNSLFNEFARRSVADLYMLLTETEFGPYPFAGIPWFSTPFGRDGILTALFALWVDPSIAKGVLRFLAATQSTDFDPERDAEPGKILHEMRDGEMARLREVPFARYYGSVDATPLFVLLVGEYFRRTGDLDTVRELWPNIQAALHWIDTYGDPDGDGFVEYQRKNAEGLVNQGWKDSYDAIFHEDGRLAEGPIALCEVQAYVYGAKRHAAALALALDHSVAAATLSQQAEALRERFEAAFWCDDLATYALALDGAKQPCRVSLVQCRACVADGDRRPRARRTRGRHAARHQLLFRMGCAHGGAIGRALQSDFIPQRLGLAARQRGDRPGSRPLWSEIRCPADLQGPLSGRELYGLAAAPGAVLRVCLAATNRTDTLPGRLRAAGLGKRHRVRVAAGEPRSELRSDR